MYVNEYINYNVLWRMENGVSFRYYQVMFLVVSD